MKAEHRAAWITLAGAISILSLVAPPGCGDSSNESSASDGTSVTGTSASSNGNGSGGAGGESSSITGAGGGSGGSSGSGSGGSGGSGDPPIPGCSSGIWDAATDVGVVAPSPALDFGPMKPFSVGMWIYIDSDKPQDVMVKGDSKTIDWSISFSGGTSELCLTRHTDQILSCGQAFVGQWHHHVVTYTGNSTHWYMDGNNNATTNVFKLDPPTATPIRVGNSPAGLQSFTGKMDDLTVWGKVLSDADVQNLYSRASTPANLGGVVAQWPFNEGTGTVAGDISGNAHDMYLTNVSWGAVCAP